MDLYVHIYEEDKDSNMEAISDNIFDNIFSETVVNSWCVCYQITPILLTPVVSLTTYVTIILVLW